MVQTHKQTVPALEITHKQTVPALEIATKRERICSSEGHKNRICHSRKNAYKNHVGQKILAPLLSFSNKKSTPTGIRTTPI